MNEEAELSPVSQRPHRIYAAILVVLTLWMSLPGLFSMPVIDRDEARYAQATVQMIESGDYIDIRFQDEARHKKPVGIYWMQAASVKALTDPGERKIWAHRLPSVLGAVLAVLLTFWAGTVALGRQGAFWGAAVLATAALFVFEAHIAKTDAMLCATAAGVLGALLHLRQGGHKHLAILFWGALALSIMIKGPVVPAITFLALIGLFAWEREAAWMKVLISWQGIALALVIILPWTIMIGMATDGAFFKTAIGGDLAPKLADVQEQHGGPPGYYLLTLPILFWPGILFLVAGFAFAFKFMKPRDGVDPRLAQSLRLLLVWILPYWFILEIVPTKLPNYLLPAYPAMAILCGGAISTLLSFQAFKTTRRIGAVFFLIVTVVLVTVVLSGEALYAEKQNFILFILGIVCVAASFVACGALWSSRVQLAVISGAVAALILSPMVYQFILPRLDTLFVSQRVETALKEAGIALPRTSRTAPRILSPDFTEPSLVFQVGTEIKLGHAAGDIPDSLEVGDILLFNVDLRANKERLSQIKIAMSEGVEPPAVRRCLDEEGRVKGVNYSKGDPVTIAILKVTECAREAVTALSETTETPEPTPVP